jgi:hypothetical protein
LGRDGYRVGPGARECEGSRVNEARVS